MWEKEGEEMQMVIHDGGIMRCRRQYEERTLHTRRCVGIVLKGMTAGIEA